MKPERCAKPWWSIGTLLVMCAAMAAKINHVSFRMPEIAWWGWPLLLVAGIALNVGFFVWLAMITTENRKVEGAEHLQVAAIVVLLLVVML